MIDLDEFYEFEFNFNFDFEERQSATQSPKPQPIGKPDPVREKIYDMRWFASDNPNNWNESKLFYRQGKFMEDFEDDYAETQDFSMFSPSYQRLGYNELRTYFTWRTKVRRGEIPSTSLSCVFLYIYELLCGIGVSDPADGLEKIMRVWRDYVGMFSALDDFLPDWLRDYFIYYNLGYDFEDFVAEHDLHRFYNKMETLADWGELASYDINKSKFYNDGNQQLMADCFDRVLDSLRKMCDARRLNIADLFSYKSGGTRWHMFKRATFYHWYLQPDKIVELSDGETFACVNNIWTVASRVPYNFQKDLVGFIIKQTEAHLRETVGYKTKISANRNILLKTADTLMSKGITMVDVIYAINSAVEEFHKDLTRVVVEVDRKNLSRIREEAAETQEKLIVEDVPPQKLDLPLNSVGRKTQPTELSFTAHEENSVQENYSDSLSNETNDIWLQLKSTLTPVEILAIKSALNNENMYAFAAQHGIMPEVLVDSINEKSMDLVGDSLLDGEFEIYDDYKNDLMKVVT